MKRASIDIGSNSTLLLIANVKDNVIEEVIASESRVTGLGRELDERKEFLPVAQDETLEALIEYVEMCKKEGISPSQIIATATEASRVAKNSVDFYEKVYRQLGLRVRIITSSAEAKYTAIGIVQSMKAKSKMGILDIGGASTELMTVSFDSPSAELALSSFSLPVGAVRVTNWLESKVWPEKFHQVVQHYSEQLKKFTTDKLYCSAGTMTSIANMVLGHKHFVEEDAHNFVLTKSAINHLVNTYRDCHAQDFLKEFPFLGKRAFTIKGGLLLIQALGEHLPQQEYVVTTYGLRYGTLISGVVEDSEIFTVK